MTIIFFIVIIILLHQRKKHVNNIGTAYIEHNYSSRLSVRWLQGSVIIPCQNIFKNGLGWARRNLENRIVPITRDRS